MKLLKAAFLVSLILVIGGCSEQIYAQRCGGDVSYIVRDGSGAINALNGPGTVRLKFIRINPSNNSTEPVSESGKKNSAGDTDPVKIVRVKTGCGLALAEVGLEIEGRVMLLRFYNLPGETNFYVDSLPFQEGTFEIDFKRQMGLGNQELNREGLRDTDGRLFLRGTAHAGYLVSANNWKVATTQW